MAKQSGTTKDVVIRFRGQDDGSVKNMIRQTIGQFDDAAKRIGSLQKTFKAGFSLAVGREFKEFFKGTLADVQKAGSPLQKMLGESAVSDAQRLIKTFDDIKLSIQGATLSILREFSPALRAAADVGKTLSERLGGGHIGVGKEVATERQGMKTAADSTQESIDKRVGQLTALERQRATVGKNQGMFDWRSRSEKNNQASLLDAQIFSLKMEIGGLQMNMKAINDLNMKQAFEAMKKNAMSLATGLEGAGRDIMRGITGTGKSLWDKGMGGIQGIKDKAWEEQRQRSMGIIESTKTPAERMQEQYRELVRLRDAGGIQPATFERAKQNLLVEGYGQLPQQKRMTEAPGLQASISRMSTMGPQQPQIQAMTKVDKSINDQTKRLELALKAVLDEIKGEGDQGGA